MLAEQQVAWTLAMNSSQKIASHYWQNATLILEHQLYSKPGQIEEKLFDLVKSEGKLIGQQPQKLIPHRDNNYFEIGHYQFKKSTFAYLIGWKKVENNWLREIEILFKTDDTSKTDRSEIDKAREKWVELSNAHDHKVLVKEVYTPDALYINGGNSYQGTEQINDRYAYMSNPSWKIQLYPKELMQAQPGIYYEIGEYVSNGKGHYVIIWEKQESGEWQACLDFNF